MRLCFVFFLAMFSFCASAQQCTRYVMMNAFDEKAHQPIDGLKASDFMAKLDGRPVAIAGVTQQLNNRVLVLVEAKMQKGYPGVTGLAENVTQQARNAPDGRPIAFGAFGTHALLTDGFLSEKAARARAIDDVLAQQQSMEAKSGLYDALHEALLLFGRHQPGDTILLVSDGHDSKSTISSSDITRELMAAGVRLNILTGEFGYEFTHPGARKPAKGTMSNTLRLLTWDDGLRPFADRTGGIYGSSPERALESSWSGYLVELQLPAKTDNTKLEVEVRDTSGKPSKNIWVKHPPQLAPCAASVAAR